MAMVKGLYGTITGLEALANEPITGVQVPNGELAGQTIVSGEGMDFNTVNDFVQVVNDQGMEDLFGESDSAHIDNQGRLVLGRDVGSNGVA